jgi:hypothetical protein
MARNRMLNPEFWLDEELAKLSPHARLLYQGLWGICDDNYATLPNRPDWIKAQIFPYENVNVQGLLDELSSSGRIVLFLENKRKFWYLKNFFKYQKVDKPSKPKYPKFEASFVVLGEYSGSTLAEDKISKDKISKEKRESSLKYLKEIPLEDIKELTTGYHISEEEIKKKAIVLIGYCEMHGKRYKNYKAFLRNSIVKDFTERKKPNGIPLSDLVPDQL